MLFSPYNFRHRRQESGAVQLGMAQYRAGESQAAVATLDKAIEQRPARFSGHARLFLAMAHKQLGHVTEARRCYREALGEMKEDRSKEELRPLRIEAAVLLGVPKDSPERKEPADSGAINESP